MEEPGAGLVFLGAVNTFKTKEWDFHGLDYAGLVCLQNGCRSQRQLS